ncbi:MAG: hypothetical protein FJ173_04275 [Gammaproteobacteria bacterium]|nr:hypothetical protein [Gammaproteobacteria bacterium]
MSPTRQLFPTQVYVAPLLTSRSGAFNRQILKESMQLREDDRAGRQWSRTRYPGGYTSYGSQCQLQRISPTFGALERYLAPHLKKFTTDLALDLKGRTLGMTDCWVNIMPKGVVHSLHLHPISTISGTYYVHVPAGSSGLKFEDPRLDRFMAAPPRKATAPAALRPWHTVPAKAGQVVLFESWLRHEVPPNPGGGERVSISFNFNWF